MRNRHAKEPSKGKNNKRRNPRRNPRHHKDGDSFQVAVPFKKPSTRKTKTRGNKSKTSEKEFTKPDARLMNSPTIPNDQNRAQSI
jgi:hypothetical protein